MPPPPAISPTAGHPTRSSMGRAPGAEEKSPASSIPGFVFHRLRRLEDCTFLDFQTFPCMFPQGTMPTVRSLHFSFLPRQIFSYGFELSMSHLPSIQQVTADIWCHGANAGEVKFAETEFRRAVADHPNLPTRLINRYGIDRCLEKQKCRLNKDSRPEDLGLSISDMC
ncbi:uncharacterized protein LOC112268917 [Brachypodium distachyon]|uniref:uncharacterized protein LOC112268917 n=1 Tax=Brachypodium distachyon TaxID=15368 RepID=UPI000D0DE86F|nr:uncharacterized protein LOC112268917 [Brachypodium distachyon]|eukprot:XP_024310960.1 uncharacterized protein LOC112268917 [Brachypodium distachyon]